MKRRGFLQWGLGSALLASGGMAVGKAWVPDFNTIDIGATGLDAEQWRLIAAVQSHLFPSEPGVPGAAEANATAWLQWVLSDPALPGQTRAFFRRGAEELAALAAGKGNRPFWQLEPAAKESLLRAYEQQGGSHWLRELIHYVLEALLSDPVYGGNPDGIGWRWLEHRPGYRRPSPLQRYFLLADR